MPKSLKTIFVLIVLMIISLPVAGATDYPEAAEGDLSVTGGEAEHYVIMEDSINVTAGEAEHYVSLSDSMSVEVVISGGAEPTPTPSPVPTPLVTPTLAPVSVGLDLYFRSDSFTYQETSGYFLAPSYTDTELQKNVTFGVSSSVRVSYNITLLDQYGGSTVMAIEEAEGFVVQNASGALTSQWSCPDTDLLLSAQALKIDILSKIEGGAYSVLASFVSDKLPYTGFAASTWTFKLYYEADNETASFLYGDYHSPSGIIGIEVLEPNEFEFINSLFQAGDLFGAVIYPFTFVLHEAFYLILLLIFLAPVYIRKRHFSIILIFFVLFGGAGSVMNWFIPAPFIYGAWIIVLLGMTGLIWRVLR